MSVNYLSKDIIFTILYKLDLKDVLIFLTTCKKYNNINNVYIFWWNYLKENYNCKYDDKTLKYLKKSVYWYSKIKRDKKISLKITLERQLLIRYFKMFEKEHFKISQICQFGNIKLVKKNFNIFTSEINKCLKFGASNSLEIVKFLIQKGATNFDEALVSATHSNKTDIIEFLIQKGATDFNGALKRACRNGNNQLIEFFIKKGADNWDNALIHSIYSKNYKNIYYFLDKMTSTYLNQLGKRNIKKIYNNCLRASSRIGDLNLIKIFIDKGADNWSAGLIKAIEGNHYILVDFFISKGVNKFGYGLKTAIRVGNLEMFYKLYKLTNKEELTNFDISSNICYNKKNNRIEMIDFLFNEGFVENLNMLTNKCIFTGNKKLLKYLLNKGADNFNIFLRTADIKDDQDIYRLIKQYKLKHYLTT